MIRALLAALLLAEPSLALAAAFREIPAGAPLLQVPVALETRAVGALPAAVLIDPLSAGTAGFARQPATPAIVPLPAARALSAAVERIAELTPPQDAQPAPAAVSAELGRLFENAQAAGEPAGPALASPSALVGTASGLAPPLRPLESIQTLKVGTYNVENLFHQVGSHVPDPDRPGMLMKVSDAKPKPDWAMAEQGKLIQEEGLDVLVMQEVEDAQALEDFNRRFLGGAYRTFLIEGNDQRGIDVAFMVKKDIPFELEQRTHKDETWQDPVLGGTKKLFSRDLTSLIFRAPGKADPLFVLFGTHYKSKRDRSPKDPESNILRAAQAKRTAEIVARYKLEFGDAPMMLAGDFNGTVPEDKAFDPLFMDAGLTDAFDASPNPPSDRDRITHTYHPRGGPAHYAQMDALLVTKSLRGTVSSAVVYRYKYPDGTVKPLPRTYEEREKNPSDHFPVIVSLAFQPILTKKFPDWKPAPKPAPKADDGLEEFAYERLKDAEPVLRARVLALTRAYMSAERPDRQAAYYLDDAYRGGLEVFERYGIALTPEVRAQLQTLLSALGPLKEPEFNALLNTFLPLLDAFDRGAEAAPPPVVKRSPKRAARDFADSLRAWAEAGEAAFDGALADWRAWLENPVAWLAAHGKNGYVDRYTLVNLREIRRRLDAAAAAKAAFDRELAALPAEGPADAGSAQPLFKAWDELRGAANDTRLFVTDSRHPEPLERGLIANTDQNRGHHPDGLDAFLAPGLSADWEAARILNDYYAGVYRPGGATPGSALRDMIWSGAILPTAYSVLPVSNGGWRNALKTLLVFLTLGRTFDHDGDKLPLSRLGFKLLHPFGSVLKVSYRSRGEHPFTGLLAGADVPGLMRLSLGAPESSGKFIPGVAIKLFPDDAPSANAVFLGERTGVDGQQPDRNFFAQAFTNDLPKPRLLANKIAAFILGLFNRGNALYIPVDAFAERNADGSLVEDPRAPYSLHLKPVPGRATPSDSARDVRVEHAALAVGALFEVYAGDLHIGDIVAQSEAVASEYGDKGLFFRHRRGRRAKTARK